MALATTSTVYAVFSLRSVRVNGLEAAALPSTVTLTSASAMAAGRLTDHAMSALLWFILVADAVTAGL